MDTILHEKHKNSNYNIDDYKMKAYNGSKERDLNVQED